MDFFSVPTATFRVFQVLFIIRHGRREVARCTVTTTPTAAWVAHQLREAFPFESAPRFMILDRGAIFSAGVMAILRSMKVEPTRTSFRRGVRDPTHGSRLITFAMVTRTDWFKPRFFDSRTLPHAPDAPQWCRHGRWRRTRGMASPLAGIKGPTVSSQSS